MTNGRYKLIRYTHLPHEELYDLRNDPYELNNLLAHDAGVLRRDVARRAARPSTPCGPRSPGWSTAPGRAARSSRGRRRSAERVTSTTAAGAAGRRCAGTSRRRPAPAAPRPRGTSSRSVSISSSTSGSVDVGVVALAHALPLVGPAGVDEALLLEGHAVRRRRVGARACACVPVGPRGEVEDPHLHVQPPPASSDAVQLGRVVARGDAVPGSRRLDARRADSALRTAGARVVQCRAGRRSRRPRR